MGYDYGADIERFYNFQAQKAFIKGLILGIFLGGAIVGIIACLII